MDKIEKMMKGLGITLAPADKKLEGLALFKRIMQLWMPAGVCFTKAIREIVPNPAAAQEKRFTLLTGAPATDPTALAVKACSPKGTLLFQMTKLTPQPSVSGRFYALGRVFSGTLTADKVFLMEDDYLPPHAEVKEEEPAPAEEAAAGAGEPAAAAPPPKAAKGLLQEKR